MFGSHDGFKMQIYMLNQASFRERSLVVGGDVLSLQVGETKPLSLSYLAEAVGVTKKRARTLVNCLTKLGRIRAQQYTKSGHTYVIDSIATCTDTGHGQGTDRARTGHGQGTDRARTGNQIGDVETERRRDVEGDTAHRRAAPVRSAETDAVFEAHAEGLEILGLVTGEKLPKHRRTAKREAAVKRAIRETDLETVVAAARGIVCEPYFRGETSRAGRNLAIEKAMAESQLERLAELGMDASQIEVRIRRSMKGQPVNTPRRDNRGGSVLPVFLGPETN